MAKVILEPIGAPLDDDDPRVERNRTHMAHLEEQLKGLRSTIRAGWGAKYSDRVHAKGKMTTWERVEALADPGTAVLPLGTFVNHGERFGQEPG
ncbi:MAG: propionyl-CoA carboxylase, partial [Myxococcota bacterium]